jgi:murein L,D-transpeptidase YafK
MYKDKILAFLGTLLIPFVFPNDFLNNQKKFQRVRTAIHEKQEFIDKKLKENQIEIGNLNLVFVAYKEDDLLEVFAKNKKDINYKSILSYKVCSRSGKLGPKRMQGDKQVPEGFYHIDRFNPTSNFYLSLGLNYPNLSDRIKGNAGNLGGDIFIHGDCLTVGCLPITDNFIKEIYLLAVYARNNGQLKIPVYIFPFKMTDHNMKKYKKEYKTNVELISFWRNLQIGYNKFIATKKELNPKVAKNGDYYFK